MLATLMLVGCFSVVAFADNLVEPVVYQELYEGKVHITEPVLNYHYYGMDEASHVPENDQWEFELHLDNNFTRFGANTEPIRIKDAEGNVAYSFVPTDYMVSFHDEQYPEYHGCYVSFSYYAFEFPMDTFTYGETYTIILPEDTFRLSDGTPNAQGIFTVTTTRSQNTVLLIPLSSYYFNRIVLFFRDLFRSFIARFQ